MLIRTILSIQLLLTCFFSFAQVLNNEVKSPVFTVDTFPVIYEMIAQTDTGLVMADIHHLQDYGTRNCKKPEAVLAQNWIQEKFEGYGLPVETQDFPMSGGASDNVLATLTGHVNPDEYVIIGGHYDSYTGGSQEPGADDNASGTAGVLEVARILSQYQFERTIVFCAFSGEEYGLYGSEAYASRAEQDGMNILGYVNLDMIGYNGPGELIHTDMICSPASQELSDFYKAVSAIYTPTFIINDAVTVPGGSDHISFENHGYQGIFPAEEDMTYSPYIHTSNDLIGPSVNSPMKAKAFINAALATIVSLAVPFDNVGQQETGLQKHEIKVFPNPAAGSVFIELRDPGPVQLEIFSLSGIKVRDKSVQGKSIVDIAGLPAGIYILKVRGNKFLGIEKLVIR